MSMTGRELKEAIKEGVTPLVRALERSAKANEELLDIAKQETVQMEAEAGPPVCPNCGVVNPTVYSSEQAGSGPLAESVYQFEMHCCNASVWAIPEGWVFARTAAEAAEAIDYRRAGVTA